MAAARRRRLRTATIAALLLALLVLLPSAAAATPLSPRADPLPHGALRVTSITPVVDGGGRAQVRGEVTNTTEETLVAPDIEVVTRQGSTSRPEIATWAEGTDPVDGEPVAATTLEDLAPGDSATFTLAIEADDLAPGVSAGVAWVSVQTARTAVHTFIGVHRAKEYVPLDVVWGIPLLLPPDRRLFDDPGAARTQAWQETVGPDSRLSRLTQESPAVDEAWLLDPSLLNLPPEPARGADDASALAAEREVRSEWATRLRSALVGERTIVLPEADADVAAGALSETAAEVITPRLAVGATVADDLGALGDVMWPADGLVTEERARDLRALHPGKDTPTVLTHSAALVPSGFTPTGAARTVTGTPLLVSDHILSDLVGDLSSADDVVLARQRLVAETSVVLGERPGTPRSVLIVPDRSTRPDPEAYAALRASADEIPWLAKGGLPDLVEQVEQAPEEQVPRTARQIERSVAAEQVPPPVLTETRAARVARDESSVPVFASVRADGATWRHIVHPALDQLTSARWRNARSEFVRMHSELSNEVTLEPDDLVVSSGEVNFFADTGRLQISIVNNTEVELTNLHVELESQNPSFRIMAPPEPVTIGPTGRQAVSVRATALAAGRATVDVVVTTPDGHRLTRPAELRVTMRPTGATVYWVIGGAAVLLLGAGTWRTVRRRRKPTASEDSA